MEIIKKYYFRIEKAADANVAIIAELKKFTDTAHSTTIEKYFEENPPQSISEAVAKIELLTAYCLYCFVFIKKYMIIIYC